MLLIYVLNANQKKSISSVTQSCPTLCDPMNCSTPGLPVHHHLPEFTQTHVHRVSDAIQPSHPGLLFVRYLGINLPKETKDLYVENYNTLMREIKDDTNRLKSTPC